MSEIEKVLCAKKYETNIKTISKLSAGDYLVQRKSVYKVAKIVHRTELTVGVDLIGVTRPSFFANSFMLRFVEPSIQIVFRVDTIENKSIYREVV